jgi:hypothetical protein
MKQKKIPMRMCVITHERVEKKDLIRIVKTDSGVIVDPTGKINGHGVYIKKDESVIKKAQASKVLDKLLETSVNDEVYEEACKLI